MGAYNFKPQFVADIMADRKRHTIRTKRKYPDKPGSLLSLFVGMRTKKCRLLKRRRCSRVQEIKITNNNGPGLIPRIWIDGVWLSEVEKEALAISDGFPDFRTMMTFWNGRRPFSGDLIHWESDADATKARSRVLQQQGS